MFPRAGGAWDFYCTNTGLLPDWVRWHSAPRLPKTTSTDAPLFPPLTSHKKCTFSQNLESPDLRVWLQNSQFLLLSLFCTLVTIPPHFSNYTLETTTAFKKPCAASTSFRPLYINDDPFFLILKTLYITDDIPEFFEHFFRLFFFKRFCPIKVLQHCMFCLWTFESSQESVSSILVYTFLFIRLLPSYSSRLLAASATLLPAN